MKNVKTHGDEKPTMSGEPTLDELITRKKNELARQKYEFEAMAIVAEELTELAERYANHYSDYFTTTEFVGNEEAQATNDDGELIYKEKDGWRKGTIEELTNKGVTEYEPYHREIYRDKSISFDELSDYAKSRALAYKKLAEIFATLNVPALM